MRRIAGAILIVATSAGTALAQPAAPGSQYLKNGQYLTDGQFLVAESKDFFAIQQGDGNFCVYKGSGPADNKGGVWCHSAKGVPAAGKYFAIQQSDGNFCTYKGTGPADNKGGVWCHSAPGVPAQGSYYTIVQKDGNLCTYKGTDPANSKGGLWCLPPDVVAAANNFTLTISPAPVEADITAFYKSGGTYAGVSCKANKKAACSKSYPKGTVLHIGNWDMEPGYARKAWGGACAGQGNTCDVTMNQNLTVNATFGTTVLSATTPTNGSIGGAGLDCGKSCSAKVVPGTNVSISANPAQGWAFDSWGGACAGKGNPCGLAMAQDQSVSVKFKSVGVHTVSATAPAAGGSIGGAGLSCGAGGTTCTATATSGTTVGLSANPSVGWQFDSWDGACKGQGAGCSVAVNANVSVSATFKNVGTAVLTVSPAPVGGDVTAFYVSSGTYAGVSCKANKKNACSGTYTKGTALSIGTYDIDGGSFKGWVGDCAGKANPCPLTMDANHTISATFGR